MQIKRDPNGDGGGASANEGTKFDAEALKNEINNSTRSMLNEAVNSMKAIVEGYTQGVKDGENRSNPKEAQAALISDYAEELETLGITDQTQANAFISILDKQLQKKASAFQEDVVNTVDAKQTWKEKKQAYDQEAMARFPQAINKGTELRKVAEAEYAAMSPTLKKEPDAEALAVERAAKRLGISPAPTIEHIHGSNAMNTTHGDGSKGGKSKITDDDMAFGSIFNVNPEAYKKRLAQVRSNQ